METSNKRLTDLAEIFEADEEFEVPEDILEHVRWNGIEQTTPEE